MVTKSISICLLISLLWTHGLVYADQSEFCLRPMSASNAEDAETSNAEDAEKRRETILAELNERLAGADDESHLAPLEKYFLALPAVRADRTLQSEIRNRFGVKADKLKKIEDFIDTIRGAIEKAKTIEALRAIADKVQTDKRYRKASKSTRDRIKPLFSTKDAELKAKRRDAKERMRTMIEELKTQEYKMLAGGMDNFDSAMGKVRDAKAAADERAKTASKSREPTELEEAKRSVKVLRDALSKALEARAHVIQALDSYNEAMAPIWLQSVPAETGISDREFDRLLSSIMEAHGIKQPNYFQERLVSIDGELEPLCRKLHIPFQPIEGKQTEVQRALGRIFPSRRPRILKSIASQA